MVLARIVVKENYEEKNDLVLRSYVRALRKLGDNPYFDNDRAYIYGKINDNGEFCELITGVVIPYSSYEVIDEEEFRNDFNDLGFDKVYNIGQIIKKIIFNEDSKYDVIEMEELARDRAIEFDAYIDDLIGHNPYTAPLNGYNSFSFKCQEIQKVKKMV